MVWCSLTHFLVAQSCHAGQKCAPNCQSPLVAARLVYGRQGITYNGVFYNRTIKAEAAQLRMIA